MLSDPTSRRPERRRSLKSTIRWSYDLLFPDDQRGLWALATFAGGAPLPAVEFVLEALDVPAAAAIDVVGRLASRSLVIVDDAGASRPRPPSSGAAPLGSVPAARQHPGVRAGGDDRGRDGRARPAPRTPRGSRTQPDPPPRVCAAAARPSISPSPGPSAPTSTRHWPGAPRTTRCSRSASSTGSAGPGSSSATAEARNGSWPHWTRPATRPHARDRASALLLAAWIEASTGHLDLARDHIAAATELADAIDDVDLQARCCYYLAYVVSHHGEFRHAMELTDRSRALYDGLDRPWDQAANGLFAARAAISAGDQERSVEAADQVQRWLRERRRPVAARAQRGDARRAGPAPAPVRRRRPAHRSGSGDLAASRFPADGGVPGLQPRSGAVPGRRLRRRRGHPGARDRQGRGHR